MSDKLAYYDQLTGLPNQIMFKQIINAKENNIMNMGYIVFFNVKDIGLINTLYGETTGDQVIKEVGQNLQRLKKMVKYWHVVRVMNLDFG
jgi:GGDEF domain-containing protein